MAASAALIVLVCGGLYLNTLYNGFVYDDNFQVLSNRYITSPAYLPDIFLKSVWSFISKNTPANTYRPVMHLIYMAEYHLFGLKPWAWHLVNIILHSLNSLMLYMVVSTLLRDDDPGGAAPGGAAPGGAAPGGAEKSRAYLRILPLGAALLFATHAINTEVVAWVAAMPELSFVFFYLAALYLYMKSRESSRAAPWPLALSSILFFFSLLSKETAITLPAVLVAYDYFKEGKTKALVHSLKRYLPFVAAIAVYFILRLYALKGMAPRYDMHPYLGNLQHLINVFPLFVGYLKGLLLPTGLSSSHVFNPVYTLLEARSLISILITTLSAVIIYGLRKRLGVIHIIAICLIVLPLLPVLYVPVLSRDVFAERYMYLPSAGYALLLVSVFKSLTVRSDEIKRGALLLGAGILLVILGLHSFKTVKRTFDWRDDHALWSSAVERDPENYFAYHKLGRFYFEQNSLDNAMGSFEESIRLNTGRRYPDLLVLGGSRRSLASTYHKRGLPDKAVSAYKEVLDMDPANYEAHYNLALIFQEKGELDRALASYGNARRFVKKTSDLRDIYNNIGNIYNRLELYNEAIGYYEKSLSIDPGYTVAANNLKLTRRRLTGPGAR